MTTIEENKEFYDEYLVSHPNTPPFENIGPRDFEQYRAMVEQLQDDPYFESQLYYRIADYNYEHHARPPYNPELGIYIHPDEPVDWGGVARSMSYGTSQGLLRSRDWLGRLLLDHEVIKALPKSLAKVYMDLDSDSFLENAYEVVSETDWFADDNPMSPYHRTNARATMMYRGAMGVSHALSFVSIYSSAKRVLASEEPQMQTGLELGAATGAMLGAKAGVLAAGPLADHLSTIGGYQRMRYMPSAVRILSGVGAGIYGASLGAELVQTYGATGALRYVTSQVHETLNHLDDLDTYPEAAVLAAAPFIARAALNFERFGQATTPRSYLPRTQFKEGNKPQFMKMSQVRAAETGRKVRYLYAVDRFGNFRISPVSPVNGSAICHADLFKSKPAVVAGEFTQKRGFNQFTGHYRVPRDGRLSRLVDHVVRYSEQSRVWRYTKVLGRIAGTTAVVYDTAQHMGMTSEFFPNLSPGSVAVLGGLLVNPYALAAAAIAPVARMAGEASIEGANLYERQLRMTDYDPVVDMGAAEQAALRSRVMGHALTAASRVIRAGIRVARDVIDGVAHGVVHQRPTDDRLVDIEHPAELAPMVPDAQEGVIELGVEDRLPIQNILADPMREGRLAFDVRNVLAGVAAAGIYMDPAQRQIALADGLAQNALQEMMIQPRAVAAAQAQLRLMMAAEPVAAQRARRVQAFFAAARQRGMFEGFGRAVDAARAHEVDAIRPGPFALAIGPVEPVMPAGNALVLAPRELAVAHRLAGEALARVDGRLVLAGAHLEEARFLAIEAGENRANRAARQQALVNHDAIEHRRRANHAMNWSGRRSYDRGDHTFRSSGFGGREERLGYSAQWSNNHPGGRGGGSIGVSCSIL